MNQIMTVDVWSDVVCPFCYLGSRQLDLALAQFEHAESVEVRLHAFELDPRAPLVTDVSLDELVAHKYGLPLEKARELHVRMESQAASLGLAWHLAAARPANTFDAHRLIALASRQGLGEAMSQRLFQAYFSDGDLLSDHGRLAALAEEVGVAGASELLGGDDLATVVREDEAAAQDLGINGVPAFLVDGAFMIPGAQGTDKMVEVLRRAWDRREAG